jgi:K+-transporting ATPase ATPase A chain
MTLPGWAQIALVLALIAAAAFPLGRYMARVFEAPAKPSAYYRLLGVDPTKPMGWLGYAGVIMILSAMHFVLLYAMLRLQFYLPFNPQHIAGMSPRLAFNTAMSFLTNTNWQVYVPEQQISYGSQMWGLTAHMFLSAAAAMAAALAVSRAFGRRGVGDLGNAWVDLTRIITLVLLPLAVLVGLVLMIGGVPQTLSAYPTATTLEHGEQIIALGPVAFMEAIKLLGTNGGGFLNANSAHPFENPSAFTCLVQIWSFLVIPFSLAIMFGHIVGDKRQGRALFIAMGVLLVAGTLGVYAAESASTPMMAHFGVDTVAGNMEGKDVRFGVPLSSFFAAATTGTSCGAVNTMHDSLTPLGGAVTLFMMELGEVAPGGVGSGLFSMIVYALLAVFIAGLMVGRTPEYLGKKVQSREIKLAMLAVLILPLAMLGGTAISLSTASGLGSLENAGPHGLSEMLYAWTSATANNGSAFAGISGDTPLLDYGLATAMLLGRFAFLIPVLAIAGSLAAKPKIAVTAGTLPTHGMLFVGLLLGVIIILSGLQFLPALSLGPIAEHFAMIAGKTF